MLCAGDHAGADGVSAGCVAPCPSDRVDGPRQYASIMTKDIQPKAKELGLPHFTWRLFRHWHATLLGDASVPIKATQERLGHSRPEFTIKYYRHLTSLSAEKAAKTASLAPRKTPQAEPNLPVT